MPKRGTLASFECAIRECIPFATVVGKGVAAFPPVAAEAIHIGQSNEIEATNCQVYCDEDTGFAATDYYFLLVDEVTRS
ncbi:hypothetical protein ACFL2H_14095, partial [Planctomycetota bacterium]